MKRLLILGFAVLSGAIAFSTLSLRKMGIRGSTLAGKIPEIQPSVTAEETPEFGEFPTYFIPKEAAIIILE